MAFGKWIGGTLGWIIGGGPLGALLGFTIGSFFDSASDFDAKPIEDVNRGERNSFLFSLLVLSSVVIKADGKIMHSEMEYVRKFIRQAFGDNAVAEADEILRNLFKQEVDVVGCSAQIAANMQYGERLQLLHYLIGIASADGTISTEEINVLRSITIALQLQVSELDSILNMGKPTLDSAYKVLELSPSADNDAVKKAYRSLALKHHPDRVSGLGEDIQKASEQKFKKINEAYEMIKKARGF